MIIDQANSFYQKMMDGEGHAGALTMADMFMASMDDHIRQEEALMSRVAYPGMTDHQAKHRAFLVRLGQLKADIDALKNNAAADLFEFSAAWLKDHVLGEDKKLAQHIHKAAAA